MCRWSAGWRFAGVVLTVERHAAVRADRPRAGASGAGRRARRDAIGTYGGRGTPFGVADGALYRGNCYYEEDGGDARVRRRATRRCRQVPTPRAWAGDRALGRTGRGGGAEG
ncbi:hypothetical protein Nm8I071_53460 [Nonomuraea sp. TT08I-71]|nr:hypothetical protein Nm8I071_53460 [Nonomuraea sp. TT08I-71]